MHQAHGTWHRSPPQHRPRASPGSHCHRTWYRPPTPRLSIWLDTGGCCSPAQFARDELVHCTRTGPRPGYCSGSCTWVSPFCSLICEMQRWRKFWKLEENCLANDAGQGGWVYFIGNNSYYSWSSEVQWWEILGIHGSGWMELTSSTSNRAQCILSYVPVVEWLSACGTVPTAYSTSVHFLRGTDF